jgi:hypothetical protein
MTEPHPTLWETVVSRTPEVRDDQDHEHEAAKMLAWHPVDEIAQLVRCERASDTEKRIAFRMIREAAHVALDDEEADTE